jgi:hypothetical protein
MNQPLADGDGGVFLPTFSLHSGSPPPPQPYQSVPGSTSPKGIEESMMSTVLGMLLMMPVVFVVGGYALVSRP